MIRTLVDAGVTTCFTNPGTSEMHFVAALDSVPEMRGVLGLFEGVATGAADGYARMTGDPACTLLHLGPGLGNGLANLHNARRAATPVVNIVGDHATYHARYDAPLASDIDTVARNVSGWIGRPERTEDLCRADGRGGRSPPPAPPGQVATLILPADVSWSDGATPEAPTRPLDPGRRRLARRSNRSPRCCGRASRWRSCSAVRRCAGSRCSPRPAIAAGTGARLFGETFVARTERGAGIPPVEKIQYFSEMAEQQLAGLRHLVLVDAISPVTFFAYPGRPSDLVPDGVRGARAGHRTGRRRRRAGGRGRARRHRRRRPPVAAAPPDAPERRADRGQPRRSRRRHDAGRHDRVRRVATPTACT